MGIEKGSRLGPFEILGPLGAGGMGEVYRAKDTRLGRDVAIKALPEEFSRDPERLARFEREARILASLQHANIAGIYGLEVVDGRRYLVLEFIEGETLADRIGRGAIPVEETIDIARAIATALEAAHESGIVHRDLKPGNVMLTRAGDVKVLDFGLAKGTDPSASDPNLSASPTLTYYSGTQAGVILGTAAYMSPEQARGRSVDRRTDIWSFGCLVFECLTARQTFAGETVSDIVAHILQSEPAWDALPAKTPERLRGLLRRCLEKDVKRRQRDIGDARIELEDLQALRESNRMSRTTATQTGPAGVRFWAAFVAAAVAAAVVTWFVAGKWHSRAETPAARFEIGGPRHYEISPDAVSVALSPDGQWIAMIVADSSFALSLWVRRIDSLTPKQLPGTANATLMFWSPDSRSLAFFAGDRVLSKVAIAGGNPERISEVKVARGGTWNQEDVILFAPYSNGGLYRVSANGGEPVEIAHPDSAHGETGLRFPWFLPDGKHFLCTGVPLGPDGKFPLYLGSLGGERLRQVGRFESGAVYAEPGWVITTRDQAIVAQRFDAGAGKLRGEPIRLGDAPAFGQFSGAPRMSVSRTGTIAFVTRTLQSRRLFWMDLAGHETAIPGFANSFYFYLMVSPDDRRALLSGAADDYHTALSLVDLERGTVTRLTEPGEDIGFGVWSPDGQRVAYMGAYDGRLVIRSLADGTKKELIASDHGFKGLDEWSRDGRYILIERLDPVTKWDVWLVPVDGDTTVKLAVRTPANDQQGRLSPDGKWLAFMSDESGIPETYVSAVGSSGLKYQVTSGGGAPWYWARDGKSLVFQKSDEPQVLYRAQVRLTPEFSLGPPSAFMRLPEDLSYAFPDSAEKRFLMLVPAEKRQEQTITLVQNWSAALKKP